MCLGGTREAGVCAVALRHGLVEFGAAEGPSGSSPGKSLTRCARAERAPAPLRGRFTSAPLAPSKGPAGLHPS
jgi:hypothetical protein